MPKVRSGFIGKKDNRSHRYIGSELLGVRSKYGYERNSSTGVRISEVNSDDEGEQNNQIAINTGIRRQEQYNTSGQGTSTGLVPYNSGKANILENRVLKRGHGDIVPSNNKRQNTRGELANYFSNFVSSPPSTGQIAGSLFQGNYLRAGLQTAHKVGHWALNKYQNREVAQVQPTQRDEVDSGANNTNNMVDNTPMEQEAGGASTARAGTGPGMGSIGQAGMNAAPVYLPNKSEGTPFKHVYAKSYRFAMPACQTGVRVVDTNAAAPNNPGPDQDNNLYANQEAFIRIGSSAYIPMNMIAMYMDPYEYSQIYGQMTKFTIHGIGAQVTALGARAPYSTASSAIEVANANLQLPVMDITPIARAYPVNGGLGDNPDMIVAASRPGWNDLLSKIVGSSMSADGFARLTPADTSANLNNVSARMETRRWSNRAWIGLSQPMTTDGTAANTVAADGFHHSWPNILDYIEHMINGSNHLGVAFQKSYEVNSCFYKRTHFSHVLPTRNGNDQETPHPIDDATGTTSFLRDTSQAGLAVNTGGKRTATTNNDVGQEGSYWKAADNEGTNLLKGPNATGFTRRARPQVGVPNYNFAEVHGPYDISEMGPRQQYPFIFALYNIRNFTTDTATDTSTGSLNDVVDVNFEFILDMEMEASGYFITPMYYNPTVYPTPVFMKPRKIWKTDNNNIVVNSPDVLNGEGNGLTTTGARTGQYTHAFGRMLP
uniref:Capsid protein n=1 Tax=Dendrocopos leucotos parvoviridae sp. TaxID=2794475 RepID=A0A8A4XCQ8_9VIRU|nr:MAG: hypothetical protein [Dendrocopos leucotos parvoviridae sp.]